MNFRIPAFSVILSFVVLSIVGLFSLPLLNIQYEPGIARKSMTVSWQWTGASPRVIEQEVTSVIEGLVASMPNVENLESETSFGKGHVSFTLKKNADPEVVRFELSTMLRRYAGSLPEDVRNIEISGAASGAQERPIMSYMIIADLPSRMIGQFTEERLISELSRIEGINNIELTGINEYWNRIIFDPEKLHAIGLDIEELASSISNALGENMIAGSMDGYGVLLSTGTEAGNLMDMPIHKSGDRIFRLSDVAESVFSEKEPDSYFRINGKNTINMMVYAEQDVNVINLADRIKAEVNRLSGYFPDTYTIELVKDDSRELRTELNKIYLRTGLSLLILLLFVFITSRSFRYLSVIFTALAANILTAIFFYAIFGINIHLYSLAGITVSFGIMIDASIIMVSHYCYYRNRKAFHAILAAQLTTIGALGVVFLLPDIVKAQLADFAAVIIINLAISLVVSILLIPALSDTFGLKESQKAAPVKIKRKTLKFNDFYLKYLSSGRKYAWISVLILVLAFGLPVSKLPDNVGTEPYGFWAQAYNSTLGSKFFREKLKDPLDKIFGGSLRLFMSHSQMFFGRNETKPVLEINAMLPDGCTVGQMNEVISEMEDFLSGYIGYLDNFETRISAADKASITVNFPDNIKDRSFPLMLKSRLISRALQLGGAAWSIYGIDDNPFSNNVYGGEHRSERFTISGYNLDKLYEYANESIQHLSRNPRVKNPVMSAKLWYFDNIQEVFLDFDNEQMARMDISPYQAFRTMNTMLYSGGAGYYYDENGYKIPVVLESSRKDGFEVWNLENEYLNTESGSLKFSSIGSVSKRTSTSAIYKKDQQYNLSIAYSFIGSEKQAKKFINSEIERLNESVLPVGYRAYIPEWWFLFAKETGKMVGLLFLVVLIIFFITGVMFESLRIPIAVIGLIPASFVGLFLTFSIFSIPFDMGGMAAMVMLSGLVVNAAFYLLNEYNRQKARPGMNPERAYIRAFNHKIVPILLTVLSTFLSLIPFLIDGPEEAFWFPFAIGTMGGLLFSVPALVFIFPLWIREPKGRL